MAEFDSPVTATPSTPAQWHDTLVANFARVEEHLTAACDAAGRAREDIRLLPVSKTHPAEALHAAHRLGIREFAESRPQELSVKAMALSRLPDVSWVMIGRLQSNKASMIATHASELQSLESVKVARALHRRLEQLARDLTVSIQVNVSGEDVKAGIRPAELPAFLETLAPLTRLRVSGLMTMAPLTDDEGIVRSTFAELRDLRDRISPHLPDGMSLADLSMGMSGDYAWAIAEGATTVRIGRALFGARPDARQ